ncbi:FAD-dependent oxidoreductase [Bacillus cereus]
MLENDMICDVLVVGSGEAGAQIAYSLAKMGMRVTLIEKNMISCGSTAANTGLLQFLHDKSLTSLIHTFGEEKGCEHINFVTKRYEQWRKLYRLSISIPSLFRETVYIMQVKVKMSHFYKRNAKRYRIMGFQLSILQHLILGTVSFYKTSGIIYTR